MTTLELIEYGLKKNGYSGLCNLELQCGCCLDDLAPCGNPDPEECVAGYKVGTKEGADWCIVPRKTHFKPPMLPVAIGLALLGAIILGAILLSSRSCSAAEIAHISGPWPAIVYCPTMLSIMAVMQCNVR